MNHLTPIEKQLITPFSDDLYPAKR